MARSIDPLSDWVLGFDIGGTKIEASLVREDGIIGETRHLPSPGTRWDTLDVIVSIARDLMAVRPIRGIGLGIPGSIDPQSGLLRNAPNSPAIDGTPFEADLKRRLPGPVRLENDANCLILGEHRFGAAKGRENAVGIILGTGVGAGVIIGNRLLHSPRRLAPEPGHMPLDCHGRLCGCGNRGCVEAYLSGPSILRRYRDAGGSSRVAQPRQLFDRADDAVASEILTETRQLFVRFVAALVSLYDPDVVVLGGGVSRQALFQEVGPDVASIVFGANHAPPIVPATFGAASGKLGAAGLWFVA